MTTGAALLQPRVLFATTLGLSVVVFLFLLGLNLRAVSEIERAAPELEVLQKHDLHLGHLTEHLLEMQAARRGYILTDDVRFLGSMDIAWAQWREAVARMQSAPALPQHIQAVTESRDIDRLIEQYADSLRVSVDLHGRVPDAVAQQQRITLEGDVLSRDVQRKITTAREHIARVVAQDSRDLLESTRRVRLGEIFLAGMGMLLLLLAGALASAEMRKRLKAQAALSRANAELEAMVELRTAARDAAAARYRRLVELSADGILLCAADGVIRYANPAAATMVESDKEGELLGRAVQTLFSPGEVSTMSDALNPLWSRLGVNALTEGSVVTSRGQTIPVRIAAVSYLENGLLHVQLVLHDIRQMREEETARKDHLVFIDQLLEAIPTPMSVRDERGVFLRVNQAYEQMYGRGREQLLHRSIYDVFDYELARDISFHDHAAMQAAETITYEHQLRQPGLPERELLASVLAFRRSDNSVIGVISVKTDVTEMRRQRNELQRINAHRQRLSKRLLQAQEDERRRIARDLHDQVGQILTALTMSLDMSVRLAGADRPVFERPRELANEALSHVRGLTSALHPHVLEDLGLEAAIRWLSERYLKGALKSLRLDMQLTPSRSEARTELVAFRIVQESLTNVMRHAGPCNVIVVLETQATEVLHVRVQDDGRGFDASSHALSQSTSLGLASMQERLDEIGGTLVIESAPTRGTTIFAEVPW